jgi:hypothetical protein
LQPFFTIPDTELIQESSVDPMGLQVIWTELGQNIFQDKLTTISNDMRVFTINILHHHLINRIFEEYPDEILNARQRYSTWKSDYDVKAGLVIFLEDVFTNAMFQASLSNPNIESSGVLGIGILRTLNNSGKEVKIRFEANKTKGLLVRQIQLGMTGRYKGPMMKMEFFNRSLQYLPKSWEKVSIFISKWKEAALLENILLKLIRNYLLPSGKKEYPWIFLSDIKNLKIWKDIISSYSDCFGNRKLRPEIRHFWKDRMGLTSGAPFALYQSVDEYERGLLNNARMIFRNAAKKMASEPAELDKLNAIIVVEPFLSHTEYLFRYLSQPQIKTVLDARNAIDQLRYAIDQVAINIPAHNPKLKKLLKVMTSNSEPDMWLKEVLEYHTNIMKSRGGSTWLEISDSGNIKHHFSPYLDASIDTVEKYLKQQPWMHTYYLESLQSIKSVLQ